MRLGSGARRILPGTLTDLAALRRVLVGILADPSPLARVLHGRRAGLASLRRVAGPIAHHRCLSWVLTGAGRALGGVVAKRHTWFLSDIHPSRRLRRDACLIG